MKVKQNQSKQKDQHLNPYTSYMVIGPNGKTGRRVAAKLKEKGYQVKEASRSSSTIFDWHDQSTWAPALQGVDAVYITVHPDLSFPGVAENVEAFSKLAVSLGTKRLVLLSGRNEAGAQEAEKRLMKTGAEWVVLRCSVFNQNFSESFQQAIIQGQLLMPVGEILEPFVDVEDIADVAVASLTHQKHVAQIYELSGPKLIALEEVAMELSSTIGHQVTFHSISIEEYAKQLIGFGYAEQDALPIAQLIAEVMDGRNASLTKGVQQALGREPINFKTFVEREHKVGTWKQQAPRHLA